MKKTINQSNWSGEETTLTINQKKMTFKMSHMSGVVFTLKAKWIQDGYESYAIYWSEGGEFPVGSVVKFDGESRYFAFSDGDYTRESECMYAAAAKLCCNII